MFNGDPLPLLVVYSFLQPYFSKLQPHLSKKADVKPVEVVIETFNSIPETSEKRKPELRRIFKYFQLELKLLSERKKFNYYESSIIAYQRSG